MKRFVAACLSVAVLMVLAEQLHAQSNISTADHVQAQTNPLVPDYSAEPLKGWEKKFAAFEFKMFDEDQHVLPYRFYQPVHVEPGRKYPLVLFFHGAGERGLDNRSQFFRFNGVTNFWERHPCFIIAPQCPPKVGKHDGESTWVQTDFSAPSHTMNTSPTWPMRLSMDLLNRTIVENLVDTNRIYVTGLSMGGFATWEILQREPDRFAAAMPVCGGADLRYASQLSHIPIWVFHGGADTTVQPKRSRDMVAALIAAGGHPKYTEYPEISHDAWTITYANPQVWEWLFDQSRN